MSDLSPLFAPKRKFERDHDMDRVGNLLPCADRAAHHSPQIHGLPGGLLIVARAVRRKKTKDWLVIASIHRALRVEIAARVLGATPRVRPLALSHPPGTPRRPSAGGFDFVVLAGNCSGALHAIDPETTVRKTVTHRPRDH
jgi:hypothetical protein